MAASESLQLARSFKNTISQAVDLEYDAYFSIALN